MHEKLCLRIFPSCYRTVAAFLLFFQKQTGVFVFYALLCMD